MKSDRWQQLDELFHAVLERAPEARAAFLDDVCGGDQKLRKEVEALIAANEQAGSFIEKPALEVEARSLGNEQERRILDLSGYYYFRWTHDGRALAYVDPKNLSNINSQIIDGGPSKQVTNFKSDLTFSFAWSRDGKRLALARGTVTKDVVLISNFKDQQ